MKVVSYSRHASSWTCEASVGRLRVQAFPQSLCRTQSRAASSAVQPRRGKLPETPARTRFAPSPTGNLHLGSLRTAAFNFLTAKATGGQFLLRLEDTDQKRTIPGAEERLYEDLRWAGLLWDEGPLVGGPYGPYRQSERTLLYQEHIRKLLDNGKAYRCFCSAERLDELNRRRHQKGLNLGYDRKCAHIPRAQAEEKAQRGEQHVIRFLSPKTWPMYNDLVYGKTGHGPEKTKKLLVDEPVWEDAILIKSDGFPTYHWANVCDDHEMNITHVVRGSEWMSSTPLHVAMYEALEWKSPSYAHVPLLVNAERQKLSKRNLDTDIASFRNQNIFPEALVNFASLLGWSHQRKNDVMDHRELEQVFDLKITKGNTIVAFDKLRYLQEQHARRRVLAGGEDFEQMIRDTAVALLDKYGAGEVTKFIGKRKLWDVIASLLQTESFPFRSVKDYVEQCVIFFQPVKLRPPLELEDPGMLKDLRTAVATLSLVPEEAWKRDVHLANLTNLQLNTAGSLSESRQDAKRWKKEMYHYLRWALLGGAAGPNIPSTMEILGRATCIDRFRIAALEARDVDTFSTRPHRLRSVTRLQVDKQ